MATNNISIVSETHNDWDGVGAAHNDSEMGWERRLSAEVSFCSAVLWLALKAHMVTWMGPSEGDVQIQVAPEELKRWLSWT